MHSNDNRHDMTIRRSKLDLLLYLLTGSAMLVLSVAFLNWLRF